MWRNHTGGGAAVSAEADRGADGVGTDVVQKRGAAPFDKKGATEEQAADTADWLETLGAVDDEGYAGVIVRHYGAMGYGPGRVKQELHRRGVPRELWDEALAQLPPAADAVRKVVAARLRGRPMPHRRTAGSWPRHCSGVGFPGMTYGPCSMSGGRK